MDFINLTVKNWIEYNGRADVKHATWFRMSNSIFDEPELDDKPGHTVLVWLYILSMASKKGTPSPRIHFSHGSRMCQISEKQFRDSVNDLASIGWVSAGTDAEAEAALEEGLIKAKARNAVKTAVKNGSLKKPSECQGCGRKSYRIEGHHPDYSRPLDVQWLCAPCHKTLHAKDCVRTRTQNHTTDRQTDITNKTDITHNTQKTSGFIAAYCDRFFDRYGTNPHIDGKTAGIAKRLAKNMGEERAIQLLDAFFQMPDAELVKSKHPLVKLELKLQEVVVFADSGAFTPRAQASDVDREQADKLKKETSRARRRERLLGSDTPKILSLAGEE